MRKGSIQLSINFLVVLIICLVLFGIGFGLIGNFIDIARESEITLTQYQKDQLGSVLLDNSLVAVYPRSQRVDKGSHYDFGIGISNELGRDEKFVINIKYDTQANPSVAPSDIKEMISYIPGPYTIRNNEQNIDIGVRIKALKHIPPGSYIFTVSVCTDIPASSCNPSNAKRYGDLQKLQMNIK